MEKWSIYDAKSQFSKLINAAIHKEPQQLTRHGKPVAVVMSMKHYKIAEDIAKEFMARERREEALRKRSGQMDQNPL